MNKKKTIIIISIIILLTAALYGGIRYQRQHTPTLTLYGNVDIRTVNLAFRVTGRLASLLVDEGDTIKAGQLLGKLDDVPYQNALTQAKANAAQQQANLELLLAGYREELIAQTRATVAQQKAALEYAESFYQRQRGLWQQKANSANDLENAKTARDQAKASLLVSQALLQQYLNGNRPEEIAQSQAALMQAEAALAQAEVNLQDTLLYSPSAGTIMTRAVEPGSVLNANNTVLTLTLTQPVWVRAYVDGVNLGKVVPGSQVNIYTDSRPDQPYHARVGFISPTAEFTPKTVQTPELRTDLVYRLRLIVSDPDEQLRQGMPVTIQFAQ